MTAITLEKLYNGSFLHRFVLYNAFKTELEPCHSPLKGGWQKCEVEEGKGCLGRRTGACDCTWWPPEGCNQLHLTEETQTPAWPKGRILSDWSLSVPSSDLAAPRRDKEGDGDKNSNSPLVKHLGVRQGGKCFHLSCPTILQSALFTSCTTNVHQSTLPGLPNIPPFRDSSGRGMKWAFPHEATSFI